ncbi:MAG: hypothetical protein DLM70_15135 [Chloroflexi bacterium]|nr:MAG: hypothetical protein DLM70_15135 [Chloroflexota bacterium]
MVVRDDGREWKPQCPLDLGAIVMVAAVVAIDKQREPVRAECELVVQQSQRDARVPEPDQVGRGDQQNLLRQCQSRSMQGRVRPQEIRPRVQNDVA